MDRLRQVLGVLMAGVMGLAAGCSDPCDEVECFYQEETTGACDLVILDCMEAGDCSEVAELGCVSQEFADAVERCVRSD
ncbi:MAG: hypothetical protein ABII07_02200 [Patescibacteria group bacterium]|nr:hypothetical protein [Patescibacteria group bacterium]